MKDRIVASKFPCWERTEWFCENKNQIILLAHALWWLSLSLVEKPKFYKVLPQLCPSPDSLEWNLNMLDPEYTFFLSSLPPHPEGRLFCLLLWPQPVGQSECFLKSSCCVSECSEDLGTGGAQIGNVWTVICTTKRVAQKGFYQVILMCRAHVSPVWWARWFLWASMPSSGKWRQQWYQPLGWLGRLSHEYREVLSHLSSKSS